MKFYRINGVEIPVVRHAPTSIAAKLERGEALSEDERYVLERIRARSERSRGQRPEVREVGGSYGSLGDAR